MHTLPFHWLPSHWDGTHSILFGMLIACAMSMLFLVFHIYRLKKQLHRQRIAEKQFAMDAAHELRTPLACINLQAQLALTATSEEARNAALTQITQGIKSCTHIIEQLLVLNRLVSESPYTTHTSFSLSRLTAETIATLVPDALNKNTDIELTCLPEKDIQINGNAAQIGMLLRNLIDNAIKYSPENSLIRVVLKQSQHGEVTLLVKDPGPGIPPALKKRVMQRFFRVLENNKYASGSGLGLQIVEQIIKNHRAKIDFLPGDQGVGLTVKVVFKALYNRKT